MPRFSLKTLLTLVFAVALLIAAIQHVSRQLIAKVRDGYSQQVVAVLLIKFMEENEGKWPKNWNSLEPIYRRDLKSLNPGVFEELKQRIFVDFSADIERMRRDSLTSEKPAFRVVSAKFTSGFHPIEEPNTSIHCYLKNKLEKDVDRSHLR